MNYVHAKLLIFVIGYVWTFATFFAVNFVSGVTVSLCSESNFIVR